MKIIDINSILVEEMIKEDHLTQLAVFIKLKSLFSNGCVYNHSYKRLSVVSGISINTLKKCINFFKEKGWCRVHGKNLVFNKIFNIDGNKEKKLIKIRLNKTENYRELVKRLKLVVVNACAERFKYIKQLSRDYNNPQRGRGKFYQSAKKRVARIGLKEIGENVRFSISNFKIGALIGGKSKSSASRLMKWGKDNMVLKSETNIMNASAFLNQGSRFNGKKTGIIHSRKLNSLFVQFPNFIDFM